MKSNIKLCIVSILIIVLNLACYAVAMISGVESIHELFYITFSTIAIQIGFILILYNKIAGTIFIIMSQLVYIIAAVATETNTDATIMIVLFGILIMHIILQYVAIKKEKKDCSIYDAITHNCGLYKIPLWANIIVYSIVVALIGLNTSTVNASTNLGYSNSMYISIVIVVTELIVILMALGLKSNIIIYTAYIVITIITLSMRMTAGMFNITIILRTIVEILVYTLWVALYIKMYCKELGKNK